MEETVRAVGHNNVTARHSSTFEVTTDEFLTPAGDCILGIRADRAPAEFEPAFVEACTAPDVTIQATLRVAGHTQTITGRGHPDLTFDSTRSLVARTSEYVDDRTVMVEADHAAGDLDRQIVAALASGADLVLMLVVGDVENGR
ncbi:MAG: DUF371 domain-containing protein [Halobacteriales archaeon]|nr:DUF371 domain-containing protein [Halobacteriales archaeon]